MRYPQIIVIAAALSFLQTGAAMAEPEEALGAPCVVDAWLRAREATMQLDADKSDVDRVMALVDADLVYEHPRVGMTISGAEAYRQGLTAFLGATDAGSYEVADYIVSANTVAISLTRSFQAKADGEWQPHSVKQLMVFEVKDGKIIRIIDYW